MRNQYQERDHLAMQVAKFLDPTTLTPRLGLIESDLIRPLRGSSRIATILEHPEPAQEVERRKSTRESSLPIDQVRLFPPMDQHEVWGAGVTYLRSKEAREEESEQAASFYDLVYQADRPELFFKATPNRVVGSGGRIRVRTDTSWCVPEPEFALVIDDTLRIVGATIGYDVSARDIEGKNPLYLPQAKVYDGCCAIGPVVTLIDSMPPINSLAIKLQVERSGAIICQQETSTAQMARRFEDLIDWLGRDNLFPDGVILLTGTGIIPPSDFTLKPGDIVQIEIDGIGTLRNTVSS